MKTESILLLTLCVPCGCRCRYCLLSWDGHCTGAEQYRFMKRYMKNLHYLSAGDSVRV